MATTAGAPPGSGKNFAALKGKLAGRGVKDPGALAAYIGRKKYGRKGFAKLSAHGRSSSHSNTAPEAIELAGMKIQCPRCGYKSDDADFSITRSGPSDVNDPGAPGTLRTPANTGLQSAAGYSPGSAGVNVRSGPGGAGLSNAGPGRAIDLSRRLPVRSASDVVVSRGQDGVTTLRHRAGGVTIGTIRRDGRGYRASLEGRGDLDPRNHERTAVQDLIGGWNGTATNQFRAGAAPGSPLQPPPAQTPLMRQYGIPAIRALSTPATSSTGGPRVAMANGSTDDGDSDGGSDGGSSGGLSAKGQAVYRKLKAKGWPDDRARKFAMRAQNMSSGSFRKAS